MKDELESGIGRQVDTIALEIRRREARKKMKIWGPLSQRLREQGHDLRQAFAIPSWTGSVHWGRQEVGAIRIG